MKKILAILAAVSVVGVAHAQTRSRYIDGPGDQGHLQFYDQTSGVNQITFSDSGVVVTGLTSSASTLTDPVINGRAAVLSSSATAERVIESGTATNGQIIVFTTPFTGNPQVHVDYTSMVATNTPAGKTTLTPTGFVAVGTATLSLDWSAVGTK